MMPPRGQTLRLSFPHLYKRRLPRLSNITYYPKERGWSIEFNNEVEKELEIELAHTLFLGGPVECAKFSRDGKYLAAGCKDGAYIYDVQKGTSIRVLRNLYAREDHIIAMCFSPDGKYLATGTWDGVIFIWEINTRHVRNAFKGHTLQIMSLDFSSNGRLLVSASEDNTVRLWNMHNGAARLLIDENSIMEVEDSCYASAVFSPDGRYIAAPHSDGVVRIWDVCTGQLMRRIEAHKYLASCVAFMPDGKGLVSGGLDSKLRYWDISGLDFTRFGARSQTTKPSHGKAPEVEEQSRREREFVMNEPEAFVYSLSISPDARWVASSSYDKKVRIWDSYNGATQYIVNFGDLIWAVDFSPAGYHLASAGDDGSLRIWNYSGVASAEIFGEQ